MDFGLEVKKEARFVDHPRGAQVELVLYVVEEDSYVQPILCPPAFTRFDAKMLALGHLDQWHQRLDSGDYTFDDEDWLVDSELCIDGHLLSYGFGTRDVARGRAVFSAHTWLYDFAELVKNM